MTRQKKTLNNEITSFDTAKKKVTQFVTVSKRIDKINANLDAQIQKLKAKKQEELDQLENEKNELFEQLHHYSVANPQKFTASKSIKTLDGKFGFRTSKPKLKLLKGETWATVIGLLKANMGADYVRTKEEVNKTQLLNDADNLGQSKLSEVGVEVVQDETFFVSTL